jgi:hypothetical protein
LSAQDTSAQRVTEASAAEGLPETSPDAATLQRQVAAIRHGRYVKAPGGLRLRNRRVRKVKARLRQTLSWVQQSDDAALTGWCECHLITGALFPKALAGDAAAIDLWRRTKALQLAYEKELGLTPASRAELGLTTAQALHLGADPREHIARAARAYKQRIAEGQEK